MSPMIQSLESRQLLSATLDAGVLTVTGTAKNDRISISLSSDGVTMTVKETSGNRFRKGTTTSTDFVAADVTSIIVNAGEGNDSVALVGRRKLAFAVGATINGEAGNDNLAGADGNDVLNGGDGDDNLFGGKGTDLLNGDAGDDRLAGGADIDSLNGGDGDDLLVSKGDGVIDVLDGGADSAATGEDDQDSALADADETATNAFLVTPADLWHGFGGHGGHGEGSSGRC